MTETTNASSRRRFIIATGALAAGAATSTRAANLLQQQETKRAQPSNDLSNPEQDGVVTPDQNESIIVDTLTQAEKLTGVKYTNTERQQLLESINEQVDLIARRIRTFRPPNESPPASIFDPRLVGFELPFDESSVSFSEIDLGPLPADDEDIAFASLTKMSAWLRSGAITSVRLTEIYLARLKEFGPKLECVITLMESQALEQAARADEELSQGTIRSPLHGIPWGAKDLLDTAGVPTTYGAAPYQNRVPLEHAVVVQRLNEAGAVLVAKLTLGALAYGDIWYGGRTNNPWNIKQGSSGSSAGSAAATVAGLVGFAIGTETLGSIVSPCMRCGATGLRPTFGRVARTGAMALCWSLDKIGPICRTVEDCMMVLSVINGADGGDPSSLEIPMQFDAATNVRGMRVGYDPAWFEGDRVNPLDVAALNQLRDLGVELIKIAIEKREYDILLPILYAEAASAFEEITLDNLDDQLNWQDKEAWPNTFRMARFIPAIEYVQADRFRRKTMQMMDELFNAEGGIDAIISPSFAGDLLLITNNTGHPSLTIRSGFKDDHTPHGITLWGRLYEEGTLCNLGMALENALGVWDARPQL